MGGVSVNSLCQQGGLFALSVNGHSDFGDSDSVLDFKVLHKKYCNFLIYCAVKKIQFM